MLITVARRTMYLPIPELVDSRVCIFITVPTTCSRPSIEMVDFMYVCIYLFLRVHSPSQTVLD